jgi:Protein of unknown function (DUF3106)
MKNIQARARVARQVAQAVCLGVLISVAPLAVAFQHRGGGQAPHSAPASHAQPQPQARAPQRRPSDAPQGRPGNNVQGRPQANYTQRPSGYAPTVPQQGYAGARPSYNGSPYAVRPNPQAAGHLPQWMNQHQNLSADQQERLLRQEPGFNRLSPGDQQREIQQLHRLNQMPEAQRQRRLAWNEALERLSPAERMQVNQSARQLATMPADRQAMVRRAFQDLRGVPVDQRETILNSARYNATFSPQERGVLSNLLRVEPYDGPR